MTGARRIVWLASFPKSGNTWLRSLVDGYLQPKGEKVDINKLGRYTAADTAQEYFDRAAGAPFRTKSIDEWLTTRVKALTFIINSRAGQHFVKTHNKARTFRGKNLIPPELTRAAVYIMRNPFDVAPSYARHNAETIDLAIERMADPNHFGSIDTGLRSIIGRWDDHVQSWTKSPGLTCHVMRYEDMVADTEGSFRELLGFLGMPIDFGRLRRTLHQTSFRALRKQERETGFKERPEAMGQFFYRGRPGGWREDLTPAQVARIRSEFLPTLQEWYPELLDQTAKFSATAREVECRNRDAALLAPERTRD